MKFLAKNILIVLVFAILLVGCGKIPDSNDTSSQPSQIMASDDHSEPNGLNVDLTKQPSSETVLPILTLPADDATDQIIQNLDSQCALPCFLGLTPGTSDRQEVNSFYDDISSIVSKNWLDDSSESGSVAFSLPTNRIVFSIEYHYAGAIVDYVYVQTSKIDKTPGGETDYNNPEYFSAMEKYTLGNVLDSFGSPEDVFIKSFAVSPTWFRTHILLYYPDFGVLMDYESDNDLLILDDEYWVATCPSEGFINFRLFDPRDNKPLAELLEPYDNIENYQTLENVTNFSVDEFVDAFSSSENSCKEKIQTLMKLWPEDYQ